MELWEKETILERLNVLDKKQVYIKDAFLEYFLLSLQSFFFTLIFLDASRGYLCYVVGHPLSNVAFESNVFSKSQFTADFCLINCLFEYS